MSAITFGILYAGHAAGEGWGSHEREQVAENFLEFRVRDYEEPKRFHFSSQLLHMTTNVRIHALLNMTRPSPAPTAYPTIPAMQNLPNCIFHCHGKIAATSKPSSQSHDDGSVS
ncbi:hypothetical protein HBI88_162140 [Parastagonospora nodorum]|nr:hypothetical protein HBH42_083940 [Parastagonospora nodorum]KAH5790289.1 hypothetical protein HBI97_054420 [Parastagonospora nodorum]KAH5795211.1 hypothetical protein HBI96_176900 [Parastagonospora nodorum]KAH5808721.1 hypothetical protein HBI94_165450 [Parastagonospora nodorum]KAH5822762.1 hypothetical protein HBI93_168620 [Parastagonospora nodorum]